jgi:hypothetical protein
MHGLRKGYVAAKRRVHAARVAAEITGTEATGVNEPVGALERRSGCEYVVRRHARNSGCSVQCEVNNVASGESMPLFE